MVRQLDRRWVVLDWYCLSILEYRLNYTEKDPEVYILRG